jgi:hypothetical protein
MIVVSVILLSAVDGRSEELARMEICNMGTGTAHKGNYSAETLRGRSTQDFQRRTRQRIGYINGHARQREHVWNLVAKCLRVLRYGDDGDRRDLVEISGPSHIKIMGTGEAETIDQRCTQIADQAVPKYRNRRGNYTCTSHTAQRWQAAWDGACIALGGDPADYRYTWKD